MAKGEEEERGREEDRKRRKRRKRKKKKRQEAKAVPGPVQSVQSVFSSDFVGVAERLTGPEPRLDKINHLGEEKEDEPKEIISNLQRPIHVPYYFPFQQRTMVTGNPANTTTFDRAKTTLAGTKAAGMSSKDVQACRT